MGGAKGTDRGQPCTESGNSGGLREQRQKWMSLEPGEARSRREGPLAGVLATEEHSQNQREARKEGEE